MRNFFILFLWHIIIQTILYKSSCHANNMTTLYLGSLYALSQGFASKASQGYLQAAQMAVRDINNRQDILKGYKLEMIVKDTRVMSAFNYFRIEQL